MQIINAIQIRTKLFSNAIADIAISDHSNGSKKVYENLCKEKVFDKVIYIKSRIYYYEQTSLWDIKDVVELSIGNNRKYEKLICETRDKYDYIFYFNHEYILELIYEKSKKNGRIPICARFEESILSYELMKRETCGKRFKCIYNLKKVLRKTNVQKITRTFYVYYPMFFNIDDNEKVYRIPKLKREDVELVNLLNRIFEYKDSNEYKTQYIYFGMPENSIWGKKIDDVNMIMQIAEKVGKDNFILKKHPRDTRTVFEEKGIRVMQSSNMPWEVIQLNNNFENQIFISVSSSSVLTASALMGDSIETYLLYPFYYGINKEIDDFNKRNITDLIHKLQDEGVCINHRLISDINEINWKGKQ
jgi:hypothetical protein